MTLDETIERYTRNAEYERTHGSLQGCLEFRQLAEWLKDYKRLLEQEPVLDKIRAEINELSSYAARFNGGDFAIHIDKEKVLEIIDKYRSES